MGGEIVRLWVASIDFREDMAASENLMQRCAEIYKKLRNTFRFSAGQSAWLSSRRGISVAESELLPLDRYMLARTRELTEKILGWYEAFEFHRVYHAVNEFAIVDLSSFYLDVLKDRMYTFAPTSLARRSAQTVLWKITEALVRLVAPILSFTADEVWEYLPKVEGREVSVHLALFPEPGRDFLRGPGGRYWRSGSSCLRCATRRCVVLEEARQDKRIGKGLEADIEIAASGDLLALLRRHAERAERISQRLRGAVLSKGTDLQVTSVARERLTNARGAGISCPRSRTTASGRTCARAASRRCRRWALRPHDRSEAVA